MSNNPINLALRFILELAGLAAMGYWGWTTHDGVGRYVWGFGLPVLAAAVWGVFRVPGDPGDAPVAVSGVVRLLLEAAYFGGAVGLLYAAGRESAALILGVVVVLHYLASYDRVIRFLGSGI